MINGGNNTAADVGLSARLFFTLAALLLFADVQARNLDRPPAPQRYTVQADDGHVLTVWARIAKRPKAAILLLHGRTWSSLPDFDLYVPGEQRSVMQALQAKGYATYALDMRGYGATARDKTQWLTPQRATNDVALVLQWIKTRHPTLSQPTLLGWSMGSLVAHLTAQEHPQLISALVLLGYPRDPDVQPAITEALSSPLREPTTRERALSDFITPGAISQAALEAYVQAALAADPVRADWRDLEQFAALDPARVHTPTLLIHGAHDPLAPVAAQARVFSRLGCADRQWIILPNSDHAALIENSSQAFLAAVTGFIERPPAPLKQ